MLHYAITGSQEPVDGKIGSESRIYSQLSMLDPKKVMIFTGACIGIDKSAAIIAYGMGFQVHTVVPWNKNKIDVDYKKHCTSFELMLPNTSYMDRNDRLVAYLEKEEDILLAFPNEVEEVLRSGTWSTIRRAYRMNRSVIITAPYRSK